MKDIEKIQSPDLACQVQDANPGNFAIEQEVGAMVGATVPAPTEPSADDARELGAQLLVFLRRALLPIKSALRTALADIYAHLDSRCTDYTPAGYASYIPRPYDPMGTPPTPRTLPNLLTAITAFATRKISNGSATNDGIKDGISLAHILGSRSMVTKIDDDNHGWVCDSVMPNFPNLGDATLRMKSITAANALNNLGASGKVTMPELTTITSGASQYNDPMPSSASEIEAKNLKTSDAIFCQRNIMARKIDLSGLKSLNGRSFYDFTNYTDCPLEELRVPDLTSYDTWSFLLHYPSGCCTPNLILLEIGSNVSCNISNWNPTNVLSDADKTTTFLQNFLEHICQKLANRTGQTKLTLTLSAAVYTAIMTDKDIKAELVARNWKVTDGTNNYNN